jgi:hypothetical protein
MTTSSSVGQQPQILITSQDSPLPPPPPSSVRNNNNNDQNRSHEESMQKRELDLDPYPPLDSHSHTERVTNNLVEDGDRSSAEYNCWSVVAKVAVGVFILLGLAVVALGILALFKVSFGLALLVPAAVALGVKIELIAGLTIGIGAVMVTATALIYTYGKCCHQKASSVSIT